MERTVEEIEPNHGTVRGPPESTGSPGPTIASPKETRSRVVELVPRYQVRPRGTVHTTLARIFVLPLG